MTDVLERLTAALADRYSIEQELGAGGMATVYLAEDLKHKRKVALKVLRPELAAVLGAERFVQEITTTASLQHPHILPLFDSGEADGFLYYVMPYIEGETLRDKLNRETQLGIDEAVRIATEVADALDYAHRQGVIHRDIKPENILLHDGRPMVADFGIALAVSAAAGGRMTETGLSLGTPHYMSPEQATAEKDITARSDIYSLAAVLYEMLAGDPPHTGSSAQQIIMKIVTEEAALVTKARKSVPPNVTAAVAKALEKLPADRFTSVYDFRNALDDTAFRHRPVEGGELVVGGEARHRTRPRAIPLPLAAALVLPLLGLALWGWLRREPAPRFRALKIVLDSATADFGPMFALSSDGDAMAYLNPNFGLGIRPLGSTMTRWASQSQRVRTPFFSPDGSAVGFHMGQPDNNSLQWVRTDGGGSIRIDAGVFPGGTWSEDGYVYYLRMDDRSLWRARAQGSEPERLPQPEGGSFRWPSAIAGEDLLLVYYLPPGGEEGGLATYDPETGEVARYEEAGLRGARYARHAGGYLFWVDEQNNLLAARSDPRAPRLTSQAVTLGTGVLPAGGPGAGANLAVAEDGTLLYAHGVSDRSGIGENLAWVTTNGAIEVIEERWADQLSDFDGVALGPDERYVAAQIDPSSGTGEGRADIWILDSRQSTAYPLTFDGAAYDPEWLDGRRVAYLRASDEGGGVVYAQPFDRSGSEEVILELDREIEDMEPGPEGSLLVVVLTGPDGEPATSGGIYLVEPGDPKSLRPFVVTNFAEVEPAISPDGRWIAYVSGETGRREVYVRSFPEGGRPWPISTEGGETPRWGPNSDELYFEVDHILVRARLDFSEGVEVAETTPLFNSAAFELSGYEVTRDGERLLMIREPVGSETGRMMLLLNVFDEIERRLER